MNHQARALLLLPRRRKDPSNTARSMMGALAVVLVVLALVQERSTRPSSSVVVCVEAFSVARSPPTASKLPPLASRFREQRRTTNRSKNSGDAAGAAVGGFASLLSRGTTATAAVGAATTTTTALRLSAQDDGENPKSGNLPFFLDPATKGGVVFYTIALFVVPLMAYNVAVGPLGADPIDAGRWIGIGFTVVCTLAWVSTYIFRVATKDMTYVSTALLVLMHYIYCFSMHERRMESNHSLRRPYCSHVPSLLLLL